MASEAKIARTMHPEEHAQSGGPAELPSFLIKKVLCVDLIVYLGNFMKFKDYVTFIRVLWPNHDEDETVRAKLWRMSTHRLRCMFLNGKYLEIEYNYDHTKEYMEDILVNVNTLLPVFGGLVPRGMKTFVHPWRFHKFVTKELRLNECCGHVYASCPCHLDIDSAAAGEYEPLADNGCTEGHFHHFCEKHVSTWILTYLLDTITDSAGGPVNEEFYRKRAGLLGNVIYFQGTKIQERSNRSFSVFSQSSQ